VRQILVLGMIAASLVVRADVVWAGSGVASNPTPVLQASMQLVSQEGQCFTWQVTGKVKPAFRGFNSEVRLVCSTPDALANGTAPTFVFPQCEDGPCPAFTDSCGNFQFSAVVCGNNAQVDPANVCFFTAHINGSKMPQACGKQPPPEDLPSDPNGSQPCGGDDTLCPSR